MTLEQLPCRGDVDLAEATRDPIFLLQSRRWHINQEGLPYGMYWDSDAEGFAAEWLIEALSMGEFAAEYPDRVRAEWITERVFFTREEGERYGRGRAYNYPDGWRVYCVCAEGDMATILKARSLRPTGAL